jgi:hypothetical protein
VLLGCLVAATQRRVRWSSRPWATVGLVGVACWVAVGQFQQARATAQRFVADNSPMAQHFVWLDEMLTSTSRCLSGSKNRVVLPDEKLLSFVGMTLSEYAVVRFPYNLEKIEFAPPAQYSEKDRLRVLELLKDCPSRSVQTLVHRLSGPKEAPQNERTRAP